jgi:long-chain acyl-CoA synthetase
MCGIPTKKQKILDLLYTISWKYKNSIALQREDEQAIIGISFDELENCAANVSSALIRMGIKKGDRVAVLSESRPEWAMAFFGIISAAAITVPMDIKLSDKEILVILNHSGAKCIFVSGSLLSVVTKLKNELPSLEHIVSMDDSVEIHSNITYLKDLKRGEGEQRNRLDEISDEDTALIVYTSGTTGTAKGVELTYGNISFEIEAMDKIISIKRKDRFISILPLNHMLEITAGLIGPLYKGASVTYTGSLRPANLIALMRKIRATSMICVPLVLKMFHNQITREMKKQNSAKQKIYRMLLGISRFFLRFNIRIGRFLFYPVHKNLGGHMKTFISGGAPLDSSVEMDFKAMGFNVLQGYGLTETSPVATLNVTKFGKYGSVGKPLDGVEIQILKSSDAGGREGEIIIRGPNVMKGYFNDPHKTAEVIKDGWLHTGDIGWMDEDDFLYISGRIKNLIVLGAGKKVFPEEVEQVMRQSPYIKEICVLGRIPTEGARKGYEEVYAVVVPNLDHFEEKNRISDKAVKEKISLEISQLSGNLADYKKIRKFEIFKGDLPETSTRKIKRNELHDLIQKAGKIVNT